MSKVGQKLFHRDKDTHGVVAYIGPTDFAPGVWVGIILDEAKGKNNGSVQGKSYFECAEKHGKNLLLKNHEKNSRNFVYIHATECRTLFILTIFLGMFVRQSQLGQIADIVAEPEVSPKAKDVSPKAGLSPKSPNEPTSGLKKPGIPTPGVSRPGSKLPTPGSGPTGQGRSPSFTNLKLSKDRSGPGIQGQSSMQRERSFVERNFVETLKQPQIKVETPSPVSSRVMGSSPASGAASTASPAALATQKMAERLEEKAANLATSQELSKAKDEIIDLNEKLETLKVKRAKDQEKIKEFEKMRIQCEQLLEFKSKIMESQAALQKDLQKAKHDAKEAVEAKEAHAEEMQELSETVEMITLDKEMAEERAETLQLELEAAKEKVEELTLDLDIIKTEMEDNDAPSRYELIFFPILDQILFNLTFSLGQHSEESSTKDERVEKLKELFKK